MGKTKVEGNEVKFELKTFLETRPMRRRAKEKASAIATRERKSPGDSVPPDDPNRPAT